MNRLDSFLDKMEAFLEDLMRPDNGERLPFLFFRIIQFFSALALIGVLFGFSMFAFVYPMVELVLSEVGIRALRKGKFLGVWIGLFIILINLFTLKFILAILGLYAFFNPGTQRRYFRNAPEGLKKILTDLHLNFFDR